MVEERKQKEVEYYDRQKKAEGFEPLVLGSYQLFYKLLETYCKNSVVLDYGCGSGRHTVAIAKMGAAKVVGIDLSESPLEIARKRAVDNVEFLKMDCEAMSFPDNFFDVVFDGGTFSSIDLKKAWPELTRVLKSDGILIGIETFGHNPITNLKRKLNQLTGKRTAWATKHILRMEDLKEGEKYFSRVEVNYFHLISWLAFPFLRFPGGKWLLKFLEFADKILLKIALLRKYSFKVVFKMYGKKVI